MKRKLSSLSIALFLTSSTLMAQDQECSILTASDIQTITGTSVVKIPFGSKIGAGGQCANYAYAEGDQKLYLGVNQIRSVSEYSNTLDHVPQAVYPKREKLTDLGDEAVLMKDASGSMRYLVARKGNKGVVLFPFRNKKNPSLDPSDEQLKKLAEIALSR